MKNFFPVQKESMVKFILTSLMMVATIYIYSILRGAKDVLIVNAVGAELISTLKLYGVLPSAILLVMVYTKLVDGFTRIQLYYMLNGFFMLFFILFATVLYPNASTLHPDLSSLSNSFPILKYIIVMLNNWTYSLFYIMSELWGSMMISLMFFQFANQIYTIDEAKRVYPLFGFVGQFGLFAAGGLLKYVTAINLDPNDWQVSINYITTSVIFAGALLSFSIWYISTFEVSKDVINGTTKKKKKKVKMGLLESLKYIMSSKYIGLITLLILCYGVSINLVEGVWKKTASIMYSDNNSYSLFMGDVQQWTAIASFVAMLCASYVLKLVSWRTAAIVTPIMILATGAIFFLFSIYQEDFATVSMEMFGATTLAVAVVAGTLQNVLSKAAKYSFFDPTKEMAYIPLDEDLKAKGKAAADVIGGRLGKSGGAIIQWVMLSFIAGSTLTSLAPNMFVIFLIIMVIWVYAAFTLSVEFNKKNKEQKSS